MTKYDPLLSIHHNLTQMGFTVQKTDDQDSHERHILKDGAIVFTGVASKIIEWMKDGAQITIPLREVEHD